GGCIDGAVGDKGLSQAAGSLLENGGKPDGMGAEADAELLQRPSFSLAQGGQVLIHLSPVDHPTGFQQPESEAARQTLEASRFYRRFQSTQRPESSPGLGRQPGFEAALGAVSRGR
ncbi:hypothetical protein WCD94_27070, partial [Klebsiella pneumoniae]|uniref:hypothetical protein n=1 Tax=Klebsiella pneumoniae TaxID=573 RepID=UPI0034D51CC4